MPLPQPAPRDVTTPSGKTLPANFEIGIAELDAQHKRLHALLERLRVAVGKHYGYATNAILDELSIETRIHFAVEESLMRILHYPDYERHKEEHDQLVARLAGLHAKLDEGKGALGFELAQLLKHWLTKHIMEVDQRYVSHFLARGISPELSKSASWTQRFWRSLGKPA